MSSLLSYKRAQVNTMSDLTSYVGEVIGQWFEQQDSWQKKLSLIFGITVFSCVLSGK